MNAHFKAIGLTQLGIKPVSAVQPYELLKCSKWPSQHKICVSGDDIVSQSVLDDVAHNDVIDHILMYLVCGLNESVIYATFSFIFQSLTIVPLVC